MITGILRAFLTLGLETLVKSGRVSKKVLAGVFLVLAVIATGVELKYNASTNVSKLFTNYGQELLIDHANDTAAAVNELSDTASSTIGHLHDNIEVLKNDSDRILLLLED